MRFKIGKETYILSPERVFHNKIRREFITLSTWARDEFKRQYKLNFNDIDEVNEGAKELGLSIVEDVILRSGDILGKENIVCSEEKLRESCLEKLEWWRSECEVILAGNMTFRNPLLITAFLDKIEKATFDINEVVIEKIIKEKGNIIAKVVTNEENEKLNELLEKFKEEDFNEGDAFELLELNPYEVKVYNLLINKFGDENKDIEKLCALMDLDYYILKSELLQEYFESLSTNTEDEVLKSKEDIKCYGKFINVEVRDEYINELEVKLSECIKIQDNSFLNEKYDVETIESEDVGLNLLKELESLEIRTEDLKTKKIEEIKAKIKNILEIEDEKVIKEVTDSYVFLNVERVYDAIEEVAELEVRNEHIREQACEYLSDNCEKLVKKHRELLSRARRYQSEVIHNNIKEENKIVQFLKKVFKEKAEEISKSRLEKDKEAYDFITNYGERDLDEME